MMFCVLNASKLGRGADFDPISNHLKRRKVNTIDLSFPANKVASSLPNDETSSASTVGRKVDTVPSSPEPDDSYNDADWDQSNFDPNFESSEDEKESPPKKKRPCVSKKLPSLSCASARSSSPPPPSQPLLRPVNENDVRKALKSVGIEKVSLSQIKTSQPGLVPIPKDMISREVESSDLLLIKCLHPDADDSSYSPLCGTDGDVPFPTLKWTLAKSKNIRVINGKFLIDWCHERKFPDLQSVKYQTAGVCHETNEVKKPDANPVKLFSGWRFHIFKFQEPDFTQADLEKIIANTGGEMVSHDEAKALPRKVIILGDGYLDVSNKVLCPSYVVQCVQQGRIISEKDYIYTSGKRLELIFELSSTNFCIFSAPDLSSPKIKTKPAGDRPVPPNTNVDLKPPKPCKMIPQPYLSQIPPYGHFPPTPYFSPPPYPFNYPQSGNFFQFPVQQFPFPINYPFAGQANLLGGAAYLPPPLLHDQFLRDQQLARSAYHQDLQPGGSRFSSSNIGQSAAVPNANSLKPANNPLPQPPPHTSSLLPQPAPSLLTQDASSLLPQPPPSLLPQVSSSHLPQVARSILPQPAPSLLPQVARSILPQPTPSLLPQVASSPLPQPLSSPVAITDPQPNDGQVWMKIFSKKKGRFYYFNKMSGNSQWEEPAGMVRSII
jgi:hypothetical protein